MWAFIIYKIIIIIVVTHLSRYSVWKFLCHCCNVIWTVLLFDLNNYSERTKRKLLILFGKVFFNWRVYYLWNMFKNYGKLGILKESFKLCVVEHIIINIIFEMTTCLKKKKRKKNLLCKDKTKYSMYCNVKSSLQYKIPVPVQDQELFVTFSNFYSKYVPLKNGLSQ